MNAATELPKACPFPKPLWDAIDSIFSAKSRELIKDIAKTLHVDEKKLQQAFRSKKREMYLVEMNEPTNERFQCQALDPTTRVAQRCLKPVVFGEVFCPQHHGWKEDVELQILPELEKVIVVDEDTDEKRKFFRGKDTKDLYNEHYERIGFETDTKICIYVVEEDV